MPNSAYHAARSSRRSAGRRGENKTAFGVGAVTSSFFYFFSLGYGACLLRRLFAKPTAWRVLEAGVGRVMWTIAMSLLLG